MYSTVLSHPLLCAVCSWLETVIWWRSRCWSTMQPMVTLAVGSHWHGTKWWKRWLVTKSKESVRIIWLIRATPHIPNRWLARRRTKPRLLCGISVRERYHIPLTQSHTHTHTPLGVADELSALTWHSMSLSLHHQCQSHAASLLGEPVWTAQ